MKKSGAKKMTKPTRESPWEAVDKLEALSKPPKSSSATKEETTPIIEPKTKGKNNEVTGQPLCHQTMTSRECISCSIDAAGECPLDNKPENSKGISQHSEQPKPKSKEWLCGGTKIIKATKEEREYYAELDIVCPGCPDCEPEQPNTELLIVKTIQQLTTCINNELEKLVVLTACMPEDERKVLIRQALEEIDLFEKTTLFELQKAFE